MAQALASSLVLGGKGEGERRTAPTSASSSVLGRGEGVPLSAIGAPSLSTGKGDRPVAPTVTRTRPAPDRGHLGWRWGWGCSVVGFGVCILFCLFWGVRRWKVRDSDAGSRWHLRRRVFKLVAGPSDSGCYTSAVVLPFPSRMPWETCRASRGSLRGDIRSPHQRSTAVRDGLSARTRRRGRMEPHKGAKALHNEPSRLA